MATLLLNPRRRRRAGVKKHRSAAQRAATRRMLAANRARVHRNPVHKRRRAVTHHAAPVRHRRHFRRNPAARHHARRALHGFRASGAMNMIKSGAMMGVGAVAGDLLYGQLIRFLPASMATPTNPADQSTNWLYFAGKAAMFVGIGVYGRKVLPARIAEAAAVGGLSVLFYSIARSMVPASLTLGAYVNPARVMNPGRPRVGMGAYQSLPGASMTPMAAQAVRSSAGLFRR